MNNAHYQRKIKNPYILEHNLYMQVLYTIKDYYRMFEEYQNIIEGEAAKLDGQPRGTTIGDPTATAAEKAETLHIKITAIEAAKKVIPKEYMNGIWNSILYNKSYPHDAARSTYGIWKAKFIYEVAKNLKFL